MTCFADLAARLIRRPLEARTAALPTVQTAIESVPDNTAVEICLFRDPADGIWVAYPVGGPWAADPDNVPIISGLDPARVVAELLVTPAFPRARLHRLRPARCHPHLRRLP